MKIILFLNHQCNLSCTYCYGGRKFSRPMALPMATRAVDLALARSSSVMQLGFFGGEPLLEMDLIAKVMDYAQSAAARQGLQLWPSLVTNGTLLDQGRLAYLKEHGFHLTLSIDGVKEAHDATRPLANGRSSHGLVVRNLAHALEAKADLDVVAVVDPLNVSHWAKSFHFLLNLGVFHVRFGIHYEGAWDEEARGRFLRSLDELVDAYMEAHRSGFDFRLGPLDGMILSRLRGGQGGVSCCGFGCQQLVVSPKGRLYPCERLVGEDDRDDVMIGTLDGGVDEKKRDRLLAAKNRVKEPCLACHIREHCEHWCGCLNRALTGQVGEVSEVLCWFQRALVAGADRAIAKLHHHESE